MQDLATDQRLSCFGSSHKNYLDMVTNILLVVILKDFQVFVGLGLRLSSLVERPSAFLFMLGLYLG